jgi:hypothetical protein
MSAPFLPRLDVLADEQRRLWPRLSAIPPRFVLYGGTALALRLGHRSSVDLDLFTSALFRPGDLRAELGPLGGGAVLQSTTNTLVTEVDGVRLAFFGGLGLATVGPVDIADNGLAIASLDDLAATKLKVILDRAESRDYLDIAALLDHGLSLERIAGDAVAVFGPDLNLLLALKALTSFDEPGLEDLPASVQATLRAAAANVRAIPVVRTRADRI